MPFQTPITIKTALERMQVHEYVLPAIQREFVWGTDQIAALFDSLMKGYPIGSFLFWKVDPERANDYVYYDFIRNYHEMKAPHSPRLDLPSGRYTAILDGQQRLTALNIGLRGSHAEKLPRKRRSNPDAYPTKHLYLNLLAPADENEFDLEHDFRFMTDADARRDNDAGDAHWFMVQNALQLDDASGAWLYLQQLSLADHDRAFPTLSRLLKVVQEDPIINFFEEENKDLDHVLNMFIRVNSGGTVLSYSDLLLSIATAQWRSRDARESVQGLVDELNRIGHGFSFTKDIVLKAGLMLGEIGSVQFRVTNFNRDNMTVLEQKWESIESALRLAAYLLADFGFSERTLRANSVLLPIAYYVQHRSLGNSYRTGSIHRDDREDLRLWAIRSLLKPGVWGSGLDTLLGALRATIRESGVAGFPVADVERTMAQRGKSLRFEEDEIDDLADSLYGSRNVFPLLGLLNPGVDLRHEFHVDHIFPRKQLSTAALKRRGLTTEQIAEVQDRMNGLANLQLLEGTQNIQKLDALPMTWVREQFPDENGRLHWLVGHDMHDVPEDIQDFPAFYDARRTRMREKIRRVLIGPQPA